MREIAIGPLEEGQQLFKMLGKYLNQAPAGFLHKMLRKKNITLNGKKAAGKEILKAGDQVRLFLSEETIEKFSSHEIVSAARDFQIIYEDDQVLLVNKPAGLLSQKAEKDDVSLVEQITSYLISEGALSTEDLRSFRPGICNRLDRNTSGIVAAGKTVNGLRELNQMFRDRSLHKFYRCIVWGQVRSEKRIEGYLIKDKKTNQVTVSDRPEGPESQPISTAYHPLSCSNGYTLLEVELITGRSHQIRAHLSSIGCPIIGDAKYGNRKINEKMRQRFGLKWQLLHAYRLEMPEKAEGLPKLSGRTFCAEVPKLFENIVKELGL